MSSRIESCFQTLKNQKRKALVPYIVAGDPEPEATVDLMHSLVEAGANLIELGMPFSDPMADGPSIQAAHERALKHKVSCKMVLDMVSRFRQKNSHTPIVLMGYLNPIEIFGYQAFCQAAEEAGVDALLIVDLPPEESRDLKLEAEKHKLNLIFLVAPTTQTERLKRIYKEASGFLYYVSLKGVTGAGNLDLASVESKISEIKSLGDIPVNVGFGIKDGASAAAIAKYADGVVIGSKLVDQCASGSLSEVREKIVSITQEIRQALDH